MPVSIIGPTAAEYPRRAYAPIVEVKEAWGDEWLFEPRLELVQCTEVTAGQGLSSAELRHRYAPMMKYPWEASGSANPAWPLPVGWWVRVSLVGDEGPQAIFTGRISDERRDLAGSSDGPMGVQSWVAHGPADVLRKRFISRSWWQVGEEAQELGWIPAMNDRGKHNLLLGNRSDDKPVKGTYLYGGRNTWTHRQYAEYLLAWFIDESDDDGPAWTLGGQVELLEAMTEVVRFGTTQTAAEILGALISTELGVDYTIRPTDDGFEVFVYALTAQEWTFGTATLPKNPNTVRIETSQTHDNLQATVVRSNADRYKTIRVLGRRMVVCLSLYAENSATRFSQPLTSLTAGWTADLQEEYETGTGDPVNDPAVYHDQARQCDRLKTVFQKYVVPSNVLIVSPKIDAAGEVLQPVQWNEDAQNVIRETLNWTPLQDVPVEQIPDDHDPGFLPPGAWILRAGISPGPWLPTWESFDPRFWWSLADMDVAVSALPIDWGLMLSAAPPHALAKTHWGEYVAEPTSEHWPVADWEDLVITIAVESDHRLFCEVQIPDAKPSDGVLELEVPDAELWFVAPQTCVGPQRGNPEELEFTGYLRMGKVLRNDNERLWPVMAGALARFYRERVKADIVVEGLRAWGGLLGQILTVVEQNGDGQEVQAPITSVTWQPGDGDGDSGRTTIRTG
jgi:hypothetical protein